MADIGIDDSYTLKTDTPRASHSWIFTDKNITFRYSLSEPNHGAFVIKFTGKTFIYFEASDHQSNVSPLPSLILAQTAE